MQINFEPSKTLDKEKIKSFLDEKTAEKYSFLLFDSVDSTNTLAKEIAKDEAFGSVVIISDHQSAGRGRLGRSFYSPHTDGLYMSVLIDPSKEDMEISTLTHFVASATSKAIEKLCGKFVGVKWVNDLIVGKKKICGILCEAGRSDKNADFVVIGIGVNLYQKSFPLDIEDIAGSVYSTTGALVDRAQLAAEILKNISEYHKDFMDDYRKRSVVLGQRVRVINQERTYLATALEIDDGGALTVLDDAGEKVRLCFGEISLKLE